MRGFFPSLGFFSWSSFPLFFRFCSVLCACFRHVWGVRDPVAAFMVIVTFGRSFFCLQFFCVFWVCPAFLRHRHWSDWYFVLFGLRLLLSPSLLPVTGIFSCGSPGRGVALRPVLRRIRNQAASGRLFLFSGFLASSALLFLRPFLLALLPPQGLLPANPLLAPSALLFTLLSFEVALPGPRLLLVCHFGSAIAAFAHRYFAPRFGSLIFSHAPASYSSAI